MEVRKRAHKLFAHSGHHHQATHLLEVLGKGHEVMTSLLVIVLALASLFWAWSLIKALVK